MTSAFGLTLNLGLSGGTVIDTLLAAPAAPTLTLTSAATDNQPDFLVEAANADLPVDAVVTIYAYTDAGLTTLEDTGIGTVTVAGTLTITNQLGPLTDGTKYYVARTAITGYHTSGNSNTETNTIDATAPTITNIAFSSSPASGSYYLVSEDINVTLTWSEAVIQATAAPHLELSIGGSNNKTAVYASGSGTTSHVYTYTTQAGDADTDGIAISANQLTLNGGTLKDAAGNNATLTHPQVTVDSARKVDTTAPTVSSYSPADNATGVAVGATLTATFSETITLGASGVIYLKKTSDNSTVDSWNVASDGGSGAGQVEILTNTALTLHLTTDITGGLECYVIWDAGIVKDVAGNPVAALSSTTTWSFTTVSSSTPATWSTTDKHANINLSNVDRTLTEGSGADWFGVRSSIVIPTNAKIYLEILLNDAGPVLVGPCDGTKSLAQAGGVESPSHSGRANTGQTSYTDADSADSGKNWCTSAPTTSDRIGICFNTSTSKIWFRKNGGAWNTDNAGADPTIGTETGGFAVSFAGPYYILGMAGDTGKSITARFSSADWQDAAPTGYSQLAT